MFHYSDLLAAAGSAPWEPPSSDPAAAIAQRYRRRSFATRPDDAPRLKLPDAKFLGSFEAAALASDAGPATASAMIGACLETPVLAYASAPTLEGRRSWRRLAMLDDMGKAGLLTVCGEPRGRGVRIDDVTLRLADLSDAESVRAMIEEVHYHGDRPHRDVLDRGRSKAPRLVWLGLPEGGNVNDFVRRLAAIAAVDGYLLEPIGAVKARARDSVARAADFAPELILVWEPYVPLGFAVRVQAVVRQATVEVVDDAAPQGALDQARIWCTCVPVVGRSLPTATPPPTLARAASLAQDELKWLAITDQAISRAKYSPYESPGDVLDALRTLNEIAGEYADGELGSGGFEEACLERGLRFSNGISQAARERHSAQYTVVFGNERRLMGPHLRFGDSWDPRFSARVYWWVDREARRLVIGHIGVHLPGGND